MAGKYFTQDPEPVAAGLYDFWIKANGEMRVKTPSGWVYQGNCHQVGMGMMPKSGGIFTGAADGAHGHASAHNAKLDGDATLNDDSLVTLSMLEDQLKAIRESINTISGTNSNGIGGVPGTVANGANGYEYAFSMKSLFCVVDQWTEFPMPAFKGDVRATLAQCRAGAGFGAGSAAAPWGFAIMSWSNDRDPTKEVGPESFPDGVRGWGFNGQHPAAIALQVDKEQFRVRPRVHNDPQTVTGIYVMGIAVARK